MDLKKSKHLMTAPYWPTVLVAVACFVLAYSIWVKPDFYENHNQRYFRFFMVTGFYLSLEGRTHYSFHAAGIMVHIALIPIRWITWDKVMNAIYIQRWTTNGKKNTKTNGHGIVVTLYDCALFDPAVDDLNMYLLKHPFRAFFIRYTARNADCYTDFFSRYCELEFQSAQMEEKHK